MPAPSLEARSIVAFLESTGIDFRVTDFNTPGIHAARSWHYAAGTDGVGTAVDVAAPVSWHVDPQTATPTLRALYEALEPFKESGLLVELLGPGDPDHDDHVHAALRPGSFLEVPMLDGVKDPRIVAAFPTNSGKGYWLVDNQGHVYSFGDAKYYGGLHLEGGNFVADLPR